MGEKNITRLEKEIREAYLKARIKKDPVKAAILSLVIAEIENQTIANNREPLSEDKIVQIIRKFVKEGEENIELYSKQGRTDKVLEESMQVKLLKQFLPEPVSQEEVLASIKELVQNGITNFGDLMRILMEKYGPRVEPKVLSDLIRKVLNEG